MTGSEVAAVIGGALAEWRRDGSIPPAAACGEPYPLAPEFACTHPSGHDGLHGYNGPFPPEENR